MILTILERHDVIVIKIIMDPTFPMNHPAMKIRLDQLGETKTLNITWAASAHPTNLATTETTRQNEHNGHALSTDEKKVPGQTGNGTEPETEHKMASETQI
jgi:hypothetical protein